MINQLVNEFNQECKFVHEIHESSFIEGLNLTRNNSSQQVNHIFSSIVECILYKYDPMCENIPQNERKMYITQTIMKICSQIDENSSDFYDKFLFNPKIMKKQTIQQSLQFSEKGDNTLSCLFYLNEYFNTHFVIISKNIMFETCIKHKSKDYIQFHNGKYAFVSFDEQFILGNEDQNPIPRDIKKGLIYINPLKPIAKYKVDELKNIAHDNNIDLKKDTKPKTKKMLYDEIIIHKLSQ